jgi:tetratricopeptide (TPR) repeat protein
VTERDDDDDPAVQELLEQEALAASLPPDAPESRRLEVLWHLADLRSRAERHDLAAEAYEAVVPLLEHAGLRREAAVAANNLAYHHSRGGRPDRALSWILDSLERYRVLGRQPDLLRAHVNAGFYRLERGEMERAESSFRVAVQQARTYSDPGELGTCLLWLGRSLARGGRPDRALLAWTEALGHLQRAGSPLAEEASAEVAAVRGVPGGAR